MSSEIERNETGSKVAEDVTKASTVIDSRRYQHLHAEWPPVRPSPGSVAESRPLSFAGVDGKGFTVFDPVVGLARGCPVPSSGVFASPGRSMQNCNTCYYAEMSEAPLGMRSTVS